MAGGKNAEEKKEAGVEVKGKKKSWGADILDQTLDEVMPMIVSAVVQVLPPGLAEKETIWKKALPFISLALGRLTPDDKVWSGRLDDIRTRFFAEFRRQISNKGKAEDANEGGGSIRQPVKVDMILSLDADKIKNLLAWTGSQNEKEHHEVMGFLKKLSLEDLQKFVALEDPVRTKLYELQRKHHSHFFSDGKKEWDELLKKAAAGLDDLSKGIRARTEARGGGESLTDKLEAWKIRSQARTAERRERRKK